jgi:hypothetical protein
MVQRDKGKNPLVAQFGGIPLRRKQDAVILDHTPQFLMINRSELVQRVLADLCELCGSNERVEVHHIRKLADLEKPGRKEKPVWVKQMAARRRKTLVVCRKCHEEIHAGKSTASFRKQGPESRMTQKWSSPVCAVRHFEIFLLQTGGTREKFLSYQLTQRRKPNGTTACWESGVCPKAL